MYIFQTTNNQVKLASINDLNLGIAYVSVLMHRQENKCVPVWQLACREPNMQNYIIPTYKVFSKWKDESKTILPKIQNT